VADKFIINGRLLTMINNARLRLAAPKATVEAIERVDTEDLMMDSQKRRLHDASG
jgi:hypothetical protein